MSTTFAEICKNCSFGKEYITLFELIETTNKGNATKEKAVKLYWTQNRRKTRKEGPS